MSSITPVCPVCMTSWGVENTAHGEVTTDGVTEVCDNYRCTCCHGKYTVFVTKEGTDITTMDISYRGREYNDSKENEHI